MLPSVVRQFILRGYSCEASSIVVSFCAMFTFKDSKRSCDLQYISPKPFLSCHIGKSKNVTEAEVGQLS